MSSTPTTYAAAASWLAKLAEDEELLDLGADVTVVIDLGDDEVLVLRPADDDELENIGEPYIVTTVHPFDSVTDEEPTP